MIEILISKHFKMVFKTKNVKDGFFVNAFFSLFSYRFYNASMNSQHVAMKAISILLCFSKQLV